MKVLVIGGSRNIGYYSAQRLLASGATVIFLLRNAAIFDSDESIKPYIESGKARLVKGDALNEEDVKKAWDAAVGGDGALDAVLFTVGGTPKFSGTRGFLIDPPNLCTVAMINVLKTYNSHPEPRPRLVFISSTGLSRTSHDALPILLKPLYAYALRAPHADKLGMERAAAYAAGWKWEDEEPKAEIIGENWKEGLGEGGWLKDVCVVRPALLTDGACKADTKQKSYRTEETELSGGYTISRRDVAHFVVEKCLKEWDAWKGKCVRLAY